MEHLSGETLARLVDDPPTEDERRHLASCADCARALEEMGEQTVALGALPDLRPPPGDWAVLQARLVSEGLVRWGGRRDGILGATTGWIRAAAAIVLFLGGAATGGLALRAPVTAKLAGEAGGSPPVVTASSTDEAAEIMRMAERRYVDAWVQYRQFLESEADASTSDPAARFAAIEYLVRAGQAAVREVPADPFLNGILASAIAEREAQLRQISSTGDDNWY